MNSKKEDIIQCTFCKNKPIFYKRRISEVSPDKYRYKRFIAGEIEGFCDTHYDKTKRN